MDDLELLEEIERTLSNLIADDCVDFGYGETRNEVIKLREKVRKRIVEIETL